MKKVDVIGVCAVSLLFPVCEWPEEGGGGRRDEEGQNLKAAAGQIGTRTEQREEGHTTQTLTDSSGKEHYGEYNTLALIWIGPSPVEIQPSAEGQKRVAVTTSLSSPCKLPA